MLQLALDETDLAVALDVAQQTATSVDVIEVGTLLLAAEGVHAVRALRAAHPEHTIVADLRIMRAGRALAEIAFGAGADWVSVMAEAPMETIAAVVEVADSNDGEVQVELGDSWTDADLAAWAELGVRHVIMHRSHEAEGAVDAWSDADFEAITQAHGHGLKVSVTGGMTLEEIRRFVDVPVTVFIAGRAIRRAVDPDVMARAFSSAIESTSV